MKFLKRFLDIVAPSAFAVTLILMLDELGLMFFVTDKKIIMYILVVSFLFHLMRFLDKKHENTYKLFMGACIGYAFLSFIDTRWGLYVDRPHLEVIKSFLVVTPGLHIAEWIAKRI